jgi:hypothetical protein
MKLPLFLSQYRDGNSPTRLFQGLVVGIIGTLIIGFDYSGWNIGGTVTKKLEAANRTTIVSVLEPICVDNFKRRAKIDKGIIVKLAAVDSWRRDGYLVKPGYVTSPGGAEPNNDVAEACATLLKTEFKLK